jgi:type VII secretion-associated protein (TIGR03931 family)
MRLAVELGTATVRLGSADGRHEPPRVVPRRPAESPVDAVRAALHRFDSAADRVEELVVAYPAHWSQWAARTAAERLAVPGLPVRTCSSALAAARELAARAIPPPGPLAVLQVAPAGCCATVLGAPDGPTLAVRHVARSSGNHPLWVLAEAAADAGIPPCELTGGTLLVAERAAAEQLLEPLTDLLGERPVVPADPDSLAVLGALRPEPESAEPKPAEPKPAEPKPAEPKPAEPKPAEPKPAEPKPAEPEPAVQPPAEPAPELATELWPAAPQRRRARSMCGGAAGPVLAALVAAALTWLGSGIGGAIGGGIGTGAFADPDVATEHTGATNLAQYDYTAQLPAGWRHTGGLPERRRTLLTPVGAPAGSDLIAIEQTPLGYDSVAEPDRAFRELRDRYERAAAGGSVLTEFTLSTRFAGRDVIAYRQRQPELNAEVDWYVLFDRDAQLSVGCQRTSAGADAVRAACAEVVGTLRARPHGVTGSR